MDCRFCSIRPAMLLAMPTVFGPADLCEVCADRYQHYLRRRKPRRKPSCGNATGSPVKAARFCDSSPSTRQSQEATSCPNQV